MDAKDTPAATSASAPANELGQARLEAVLGRIREKLDNYESYNFSRLQSLALNIFFDLAQEFASITDVYAVCVMIPKAVFNLECSLYVQGLDQKPVRCCATYCDASGQSPLFQDNPSEENGKYYLPIKANKEQLSQLPFAPADGGVIGMLELSPAQGLGEHDKLFWGRYANRIGYQLHNKFVSLKNVEHVEFIRNLVKDIGHNIIVPNMYFKLFYKRLEARINLVKHAERKVKMMIKDYTGKDEQLYGKLKELCQDVRYAHNAIHDQYKEIFSHYRNTSLFLETLLRSSHFEAGRYVLERRSCNFKSQVIDPQVERYRPRFQDRDIEIDTSMGGVPDKEIEVVADVGLISQVYSNLFSNVVKYAREVDVGYGFRRKFMSYGWEVLPDRFGPGHNGIKLNVFSTGAPMSPEDAKGLFSEGYRGSNSAKEYGTGHGLYFIREVVRLHGGTVGFEPTPLGNNFYFILPFGPAGEGESPEG